MNYIFITSISRLAAVSREIEYNGARVKAAQTSEACCKYLMSRGMHPRIIIALCTKDAIETTYQNDGTALTVRSYDHFKQAITDYCRENGIAAPEFRPVRLLRRYERSNHFGAAVNQVYQIIREEAMPQNTKILIDTAGGMRNISIMMQSMTRVLRYYGYQTAAYYTNYGEKRIFCDHTDRQLAIMEAIAEFAQHGTVRRLRECFRNNRIQEIIDLLDAMQAFSDSIQLCRTQDLPLLINERIFPLLNRIDCLRDKAVSQEDVAAIRQMTDYIRIQFGYNPFSASNEITAIDLIRWCLRNDMIQQAVTLFTENIPKYLIQSGILQVKNYTGSRPDLERSWVYFSVIESCSTTEQTLESQILNDLKRILSGEGTSVNPKAIRIQNAINRISRFCAGRELSEAMQRFRPNGQIEKDLLYYFQSSTNDSLAELIKQLIGDEAQLKKMLGIPREKIPEEVRQFFELKRKVSGIEHFTPEGLHAKHPQFQVCLREGGTEAFKAFLMYYVYLKKYVRNNLNHASETETQAPEFLPVFRTYGINTDQLTPDNIKQNIEDALRCLSKCSIHPI